ncbi:hypothetical protein TNIN_455641 [Trichonephila inaurata madagascariensis]|uniref:Uncharacterized protein n=1 Tax=Trichonephila inaurata madagascariensis TaxID=2747483 RepID=A0A8X6XTH4_9ARAC|nr:hypothetical protein TNIN_455641 [Trichonephila inaurata madagascariensis]
MEKNSSARVIAQRGCLSQSIFYRILAARQASAYHLHRVQLLQSEDYPLQRTQRQEQAKRQSALRAGESTSQRQERLDGHTELQATLRAVESTSQKQEQLEGQAKRQATLRVSKMPFQTQIDLDE